MRYLIISDIHANSEALNAVLESAKRYYCDRLLCLGDIVSYGAEPNECIEVLRKQEGLLCIMGNSDAASAGIIGTELFTENAAQCVEWTKKQLTESSRNFLSHLPKFFSMQFMLAVHGTNNDPLLEYMDEEKAELCLKQVVEDLVIVGHTHKPFYYEAKARDFIPIVGDSTINFSGKRMVASIPSVGQPRDENPKAGYAVLDFQKRSLEIRRIEYNYKLTQEKIRKAGLPEIEAERLEKGI
ncbi:MAG: metallophosphoesterase family protein [Candidatus Diapherotrites archaeon]